MSLDFFRYALSCSALWTPVHPLALPAELDHTTNFRGIGGGVGPMRVVLWDPFPTLLRCDPPGKPAATTHLYINEGSHANHSQNTPDEWRPRRCGLFAQRGRTPCVQCSRRKLHVHLGRYGE